ncbi:MAG: Gfo/Idh/MocA family protein [Promethearchaeota archaeon]
MLRVGVIGISDIANLNLLGYIGSQDTKIVAVADICVKRFAKKLKRWGLRTISYYPDYKMMVDKEDLDIVEILTPQHMHFPITEYCAKAGVPGISVQKPMAHTITDCVKMNDVCKKEKVKLKLYENFRFYPIYLRAKELLDQGILGELLNFRIITVVIGKNIRPRDLKSLIWRTNIDICGGGPLIYHDGIHKFSTALWLMNEEKVEKVYSWIDYFSSVIETPTNIFWKYPNRNSDDVPKYGSMQIILSANLFYPSNYYDCDEFIEISGTKGVMWINQCTAAGNFISKSPQFPPIVVFINGEIKIYGRDLPRDLRYSYINSTEHFIEVIKHGGEPIYNGEQGKNLSIFAKMPYISQQKKRPIFWEEITPENENNQSCLIEGPIDADQSRFVKFFRSKKKDLKRGIKQSLKHKKSTYKFRQ